jgi:hypothetical protein
MKRFQGRIMIAVRGESDTSLPPNSGRSDNFGNRFRAKVAPVGRSEAAGFHNKTLNNQATVQAVYANSGHLPPRIAFRLLAPALLTPL